MKRPSAGRASLAAALPLLFLALGVEAAMLKIAPVRVNFAPGDRSATVTLTNTSDAEVSIQADPVSWRQDESGADLYDDTDQLLVVPRIFTVPAGGSQVVRIGRLAPAGPAEGAFRVFFTELAPPDDQPGPGLNFRLRLAIPAFVAPEGRARPRLDLVRSGHTEEGFEVVLRNAGNTHVQVLELDSPPVGETTVEAPFATPGGYLLPGTIRRFLLPVPQGTPVSSVKVETDVAGTLEYALPIGH